MLILLFPSKIPGLLLILNYVKIKSNVKTPFSKGWLRVIKSAQNRYLI